MAWWQIGVPQVMQLGVVDSDICCVFLVLSGCLIKVCASVLLKQVFQVDCHSLVLINVLSLPVW